MDRKRQGASRPTAQPSQPPLSQPSTAGLLPRAQRQPDRRDENSGVRVCQDAAHQARPRVVRGLPERAPRRPRPPRPHARVEPCQALHDGGGADLELPHKAARGREPRRCPFPSPPPHPPPSPCCLAEAPPAGCRAGKLEAPEPFSFGFDKPGKKRSELRELVWREMCRFRPECAKASTPDVGRPPPIRRGWTAEEVDPAGAKEATRKEAASPLQPLAEANQASPSQPKQACRTGQRQPLVTPRAAHQSHRLLLPLRPTPSAASCKS